MERLANRIKRVYRDLGKVLDAPESFGLGERAPAALVNALTGMRRTLREELIELKQWESKDDLAAELSQDGDSVVSRSRRKVAS